ncbi:AAA family ATPase [Roseateles sp.]|uniref:AAA family ATPase n=1 Tax=Roseateles sp. TaxID=1971397 RepID=UPI00392EA07F
MLHLLHHPGWHAPGQTAQPLPLTVPAALLVVLATEGGWRTREQLAAVFWPEATPEDARHHLRINLHRARSVLTAWGAPEGLEAERHRVRLTAPCDLVPLDDTATAPQHPGPWLQGWHLGGYEGFQEWRMAAQRRLLDRWQRAAVQAPSTAPSKAPSTAPGPARAAAPSTGARSLPGRDAELAALQRAPHPAVVVLGEPGAGKSTLLAAAFPGSPVLRGLRGLDRLPYRPVLDALRQHTAQLERALADPFSRLRPYRLDLARLMPELAPDEALPPLDALTARTRLTEALVRAFEQLAPLLVVDDLQWCDGATLEWLALLAHDGRLRWRAAARSTELAGAPQELVSDLELAGRLQTLRLGPLPRQALSAVCLWQLGAGGAGGVNDAADWPDAALDRLHVLGGGNPFLIGELVRLHRDALLEPGAAGGVQGGVQASVQVEVAQLVQRRLQSLPRAAAEAVRMAAIFQQDAPAVGLVDEAPAAARQACEAAAQAGLLRALGSGYVCAHDLIRDAVLAALPEPGVQALHRRAALWLAAQEHPAPDALVIAHHWEQAGEAQTCLAWLHRGALQLKARGRFDEARERWHRVAQASLDAAQGLRARLELAACDLFDDLARGEAALRGVQAQLHAVADLSARRLLEGQLCTALVDNRVFAGDIASARQHAARLRELLPDLGPAAQVEAHEVLIELAMREPDIPAAWASLGEVRRLAPRRPSLLSWEGQIHWFGGEVQPAHDALSRLLALHPEYCSGMTIENDLAVMLHALGRVDEALSMIRRALVSWAGVPHAEALSLLVLGVILISAGRHEESDEALQRSLALARAQNSPGFETEGLVRLARLRLAQGRPAEARQLLREAEAFVAESPEPLRVSHWIWAETLCAERLAEALSPASRSRLQAMTGLSQHPLVHLRWARVRWAWAHAAQDAAAATAAAEDMARLAERGPLPESQAEAWRLLALTAADARSAQALEARAQALALKCGFALPRVPAAFSAA